jgi:hypothetical protein
MNTNIVITEEFNPMQSIKRKDFIAMWKVISNSPKIKPTFVKEEIKVYSHETQKYEPMTHKVKVKGFVYPEHHILYNIVRGKPLSRGFGEGTDGYRNALSFFRSYYSKYANEKLYEPFKEHMTFEEFEKIVSEAKSIVKA